MFEKHNAIEIDLKKVGSIEQLRKVLFRNRLNQRFILRGINSGVTLEELESNFSRVKYLVDFGSQKVSDGEQHIQVEFKVRGCSISVNLEAEVDKCLQIMESHILKQNRFGIVVGA